MASSFHSNGPTWRRRTARVAGLSLVLTLAAWWRLAATSGTQIEAWRAELARVAPLDLANHCERAKAFSDDGVAVLVSAMTERRAGIANTAARVLDDWLLDWAALPGEARRRRADRLAQELAIHARHMEPDAQRMAARWARWLLDEGARKGSRLSGDGLAACDRVLRVTRSPEARQAARDGRRATTADGPTATSDDMLEGSAASGEAGAAPEDVGVSEAADARTSARHDKPPAGSDPVLRLRLGDGAAAGRSVAPNSTAGAGVSRGDTTEATPQLLAEGASQNATPLDPSNRAQRAPGAAGRSGANDGAQLRPVDARGGGATPGSRNAAAAPNSVNETAAAEPAALTTEQVGLLPRFAELHSRDAAQAADAERELRRRGFGDFEIELGRQATAPDALARLRVVESLPKLRGVDPRPWLLWLSHDPAPEVRQAAATVMATSADHGLRRRVEEMARTEPNDAVRQQAERASALAPK